MLQSIISFIVEVTAFVFGSILLLRFWIQKINANPPQKLERFIFSMSDSIVYPIQKMFPKFLKQEWASLISAFLVSIICIALQFSIPVIMNFSVLLKLAFLIFLQWIFYGLTILLMIEMILSWVNPHAKLLLFICSLNEPFLNPLRCIIPSIRNIKLHYLAALIILRIIYEFLIKVVQFFK